MRKFRWQLLIIVLTGLAVGLLLLLPFQVWGVVFDFLLQVGIRPGPEITNQAGLSAWQREAVARQPRS